VPCSPDLGDHAIAATPGVYAIVYGASQGFAEEDSVSRVIKKYFKLEWGLGVGGSILMVSLLLGVFTIHQLLAISKPLAPVDVPVTKLSAICVFLFLLGLQIVFSSFYLGLLDLTKTLE